MGAEEFEDEEEWEEPCGVPSDADGAAALTQFTTLVRMRLVHQANGAASFEDLSEMKYRCAASKQLASELAKHFSFPLDKYLTAFRN